MTLYLDTSALTKLVVREAESTLLRSWVAEQQEPMVINVIGVVELHRMAGRAGDSAMERAQAVLARFAQVELTQTALQFAAHLQPPAVRTLDALHIASARELHPLSALVTYDLRMQEAATGLGLPVVSPGA